ncbi:MAG: hypothetical protein HY304_02945, partial [candidate division Zixibacteria bacterium]|nr:hypothetical protein [candidate division Zixibacteria bacterium]
MPGGLAALLATVAILLIPRSAFAEQQAPQVVDLLPDLIVREADLYSYDIVTNIIPGHIHLRFANGTPNIGLGKLYFFGVLPPINDSQQVVDQRVFRSDGTFYDRQAGIFQYHPAHNHVHFNGWCQYRLRQILPNDGIGPIVIEADKTSFCVVDLAIYDRNLPNYNPFGEFFDCGPDKQGLSVGWMDIYGRSTEGQNIDITNVNAGTYWLESQVNPDTSVL